VTLEIQFANSTDPDVFVQMYTALCDRFDVGEVIGVFGPVLNQVPVMLLANARHVPVLFSGGPDLLCKDQPYSLCIQPSWSDMPTAIASAYSGQMVQRVGEQLVVSTVRRVASIIQHPMLECMGTFSASILEQFQLTDVGRKVFTTLPLETYDAAAEDPLIEQALGELPAMPDVLVVAGYMPFQVGVLNVLRRLGLSPAVVLAPMQTWHEALLQSPAVDARFVGGVGLFHPARRRPSTSAASSTARRRSSTRSRCSTTDAPRRITSPSPRTSCSS
jgi:hypothetical protein